MGAFGISTRSRSNQTIDNSDRRLVIGRDGTIDQINLTVGGRDNRQTNTLATDGGIALSGTSNTVTVTNNSLDGGAVQALKDVSLAQSNLAAGAVKNLTEIAQTQQTGGANVTQKTILYIALGLGALFALLALFKSR